MVRSRLHERPRAAEHTRLTVGVASAGGGKTTLASQLTPLGRFMAIGLHTEHVHSLAVEPSHLDLESDDQRVSAGP